MAKVIKTDAIRAEYRKYDFDKIMDWCVENNQVEWLEEVLATPVPHEKYQKTTVEVDGKKKKVIDKSKPKRVVLEKPTFVEVKDKWLVKFMGAKPAAAKEKSVSMAEKLAARKVLMEIDAKLEAEKK